MYIYIHVISTTFKMYTNSGEEGWWLLGDVILFKVEYIVFGLCIINQIIGWNLSSVSKVQ